MLIFLLLVCFTSAIGCHPIDENTSGDAGDKKNSLSEICIREVCHENKRADDLTPMEMGQVLGKMDERYSNLERQQHIDRRTIAKLYATTKLQTNVEKYEKTLGLTLKPYVKEYVLEAVQEINKFMKSLPKKLKRQDTAAEFVRRWNKFKDNLKISEKKEKILDNKDDPYSKTDDQVVYHYSLWRNIVERSSDPMIVRLRKRFPDQETRKRLCAKIASIFLFESKDIHEAQTYELSDKELITGLEESLGIHDQELLLIASALLNGFSFTKEESAECDEEKVPPEEESAESDEEKVPPEEESAESEKVI